MNKNTLLNQNYICPIGADGVQYAGNENNYMVVQFIKCAYDKAVDLYADYENVSVLKCELVMRPKGRAD